VKPFYPTLLPLVLYIFTNISANLAQAYVCQHVHEELSKPALHWQKYPIPITLHAKGTQQLENEDTFSTIRSALKTWENLVLSENAKKTCDSRPTRTRLAFKENQPTMNAHAGFDANTPNNNENLIIFHDDVWPYANPSHEVLALTTLTYRVSTGEILDADIEINSQVPEPFCQQTALYFKYLDLFSGVCFSTDKRAGMSFFYDLKNTIMHEIGHFLGFGHCDDESVPCPSDSVMYGSSYPQETQKKLLSCDEYRAVSAHYPDKSKAAQCAYGDIPCENCKSIRNASIDTKKVFQCGIYPAKNQESNLMPSYLILIIIFYKHIRLYKKSTFYS
jgi:hypothetical protein